MLTSLSQLPPKTVVILHPAAHNPTGIDPTRNEWKAIADLMKERSLFPFFDCAYQGFASGDLEVDAWPVRHFEERGFEFFVSQSFGKNMGLYGERIGFLSGVLSSKSRSKLFCNKPFVKRMQIDFNKSILHCHLAAFVPNLLSQLTAVIRAMYSNPGGHGAKIVGKILRNPKLFRSWQIELRQTVQRVADIRRKLKQRLDKLAPK
jgi:aspartate aminotransferase